MADNSTGMPPAPAVATATTGERLVADERAPPGCASAAC